jgi:hypothetical protein
VSTLAHLDAVQCFVCPRVATCSGAREGDANWRTQSFNAWDLAVVALMPLFVRESFPFVVTHKCIVQSSIIDRISTDAVHGMGFAHAADGLLVAHKRKYLRRAAQYYGLVDLFRQVITLSICGTFFF